MSIQMCTLKCTVQLKEEVSTSKAHSTFQTFPHISYSKPTRTKKLNIWEKILKITKITIPKRVFEQKLIKIEDFNEAKEKEVKEHIEKRKMKSREVA